MHLPSRKNCMPVGCSAHGYLHTLKQVSFFPLQHRLPKREVVTHWQVRNKVYRVHKLTYDRPSQYYIRAVFSILLRWYFIFNTMHNTTEMFRLLRLPSQGVKTQKLVVSASFLYSFYICTIVLFSYFRHHFRSYFKQYSQWKYSEKAATEYLTSFAFM